MNRFDDRLLFSQLFAITCLICRLSSAIRSLLLDFHPLSILSNGRGRGPIGFLNEVIIERGPFWFEA